MTEEPSDLNNGNGKSCILDGASALVSLYAQGKIDGLDLLILDCVCNQRMRQIDAAKVLNIGPSVVCRRLLKMQRLS